MGRFAFLLSLCGILCTNVCVTMPVCLCVLRVSECDFFVVVVIFAFVFNSLILKLLFSLFAAEHEIGLHF